MSTLESVGLFGGSGGGVDGFGGTGGGILELEIGAPARLDGLDGTAGAEALRDDGFGGTDGAEAFDVELAASPGAGRTFFEVLGRDGPAGAAGGTASGSTSGYRRRTASTRRQSANHSIAPNVLSRPSPLLGVIFSFHFEPSIFVSAGASVFSEKALHL